MNARQVLRTIHAESKSQASSEEILGSDDAATDQQLARALQAVLELLEKLEDEFVYVPTKRNEDGLVHAARLAATRQHRYPLHEDMRGVMSTIPAGAS